MVSVCLRVCLATESRWEKREIMSPWPYVSPPSSISLRPIFFYFSFFFWFRERRHGFRMSSRHVRTHNYYVVLLSKKKNRALFFFLSLSLWLAHVVVLHISEHQKHVQPKPQRGGRQSIQKPTERSNQRHHNTAIKKNRLCI